MVHLELVPLLWPEINGQIFLNLAITQLGSRHGERAECEQARGWGEGIVWRGSPPQLAVTVASARGQVGDAVLPRALG